MKPVSDSVWKRRGDSHAGSSSSRPGRDQKVYEIFDRRIGDGRGRLRGGSWRLHVQLGQADGVEVFGADLAKTLGPFKQAPGIKIGVVLKSLTNQYWQGIESGVKAGAAKYNVEVTVQAASSESSATAIDHRPDFVRQGI